MAGMTTSFNVAEKGYGSYRLLALLRWVMVVIFVSFGMQKFTLQSAQGIEQFISNSPFISWLSVFGLRGEAYFLGVAEFIIAALLAAGPAAGNGRFPASNQLVFSSADANAWLMPRL